MSDDAKKIITDLGHAFEEFKKANDTRLKEVESKGQASGEIQEKVAKIEEGMKNLEEMKTRLEKTEVALKRAAVSVEEKSGKEFSPEAKTAILDYIRTGEEKAIAEYNAKCERKDLAVQSDPDGGYLVTPDMSGAIVQQIFESSPMRSVASVQTIGTDSLEGLYDDDEAGAEWVQETDSPTDTTTPQLGKWSIPVHELATRPKATTKLLEDANVNVEQWLASKVGDKFARTESAAFVSGNGSNKPKGFLSYAEATTADVYERGKIGTVESAGAGAIAPDDLMDLVYTLKAGWRSNANWAMTRTTQGEIRKLKQDNKYVWQPGLQLGQPATLLGLPVLEFNDMPEIGNNALAVALADWRASYQIVDRVGISVLRDPYTAKPYVEFYTRKRVGGQVINFDSIKLLKIKSV